MFATCILLKYLLDGPSDLARRLRLVGSATSVTWGGGRFGFPGGVFGFGGGGITGGNVVARGGGGDGLAGGRGGGGAFVRGEFKLGDDVFVGGCFIGGPDVQ